MEDIDDIEKAPMLGHRSDSNGPSRSFVDEEDPKGFRRRKSIRSHESNLFISRPLLIIYGFLAVVLLFAFTTWATDSSRSWRRKPVYWDLDNSKNGTTNAKVLKLEDVTTGNRTRRFRDSLLPNKKYITAFVTAGWTNDVMASIHTIQLATLTGRIPILPPFPPSHTGPKSGLLLFSEIFDLPLFSRTLGIPIIEWQDIKNTTNIDPNPEYIDLYGDRWNDYYGGESEDLGCWSLWMTQRGRGAEPREGRIPEAFSLDVSWTPVPWGRQVPKPDSLDYNTNEVASLASNEGRLAGIEDSKHYLDNLAIQMQNLTENEMEGVAPSEIPIKNHGGNQLYPEDHLACYDYLYFMATYAEFEWWQEWTPAWEEVGKHLHWSPRVRSLAVSLLNDALHTTSPPVLPSTDTTFTPSPLSPVYIAVHIRRADFDGWCGNVTREDCLGPIEAYARRVDEVRADLLSSSRTDLPSEIPVLVMSDEPKSSPDYRDPGTSEAWWKSVSDLGWIHIDHDVLKTADTYGVWYPAVFDATMLSLASAFVGTDRSTYSLLAKKRVQTWRNGPTRFVKWGFKGADDH